MHEENKKQELNTLLNLTETIAEDRAKLIVERTKIEEQINIKLNDINKLYEADKSWKKEQENFIL